MIVKKSSYIFWPQGQCATSFNPRIIKVYILAIKPLEQTFFHHYQGSIDFNTVNIHRTVACRDVFLGIHWQQGWYWHDLQRSYYPIHSLLTGVYVSILSLGTVFPRTLPRANIRNTSSHGKHWQCFSNDADKLSVDIDNRILVMFVNSLQN